MVIFVRMSFAGNNKVYNGTMLLENNRQNKAIQYCTHKQRYATDRIRLFSIAHTNRDMQRITPFQI